MLWFYSGTILLIFSVPVFFQLLSKNDKFYFKNILKLNSVYTRYMKSSLLVPIIVLEFIFRIILASALASTILNSKIQVFGLSL